MHNPFLFRLVLTGALLLAAPLAMGYGSDGDAFQDRGSEVTRQDQRQQSVSRDRMSQPSLRQQQSSPVQQQGMRPGQNPGSRPPGMGRGAQPGARQPGSGPAMVNPANESMEEARERAEQKAGDPPEYLGD